jgi:exosortase
VPVFALVLLWLRRDRLANSVMTPTWWGAAVLAGGIALRLLGTYFNFLWFDEISLIPCLAGVLLLSGGWTALTWAWPALLFLVFMIPLPYRIGVAMAAPLRHLATLVCTFLLQTLGLPALSEGNVILLNDTRLDVAEACSGLRMLVIFFALSTAVALLIRRPLWERLVIVASAIPIALVANVSRITATGVLYETVGGEAARAVYHDLAGWLMMPIGLGLLWAELKLLSALLVMPEDSRPRLVRLTPAPARRAAAGVSG